MRATLQNFMAGALRFELRISGLESDVLPVDTMLPQNLVHRDGLEPPKPVRASDLQSPAIAALPTMHKRKDFSCQKSK